MLRRLPPTSASVVDPSRPFCHPPNPSHPYLSAAGPASPQSGSHPPRSMFQRRRRQRGWAGPRRRAGPPRRAQPHAIPATCRASARAPQFHGRVHRRLFAAPRASRCLLHIDLVCVCTYSTVVALLPTGESESTRRRCLATHDDDALGYFFQFSGSFWRGRRPPVHGTPTCPIRPYLLRRGVVVPSWMRWNVIHNR
jgi:hypothetical protein